MVTIKSVFEDVAGDVSIDAKLLKRIHEFERAFVNRNEDHIAFFGGQLLGTKPMRFRTVDRENWFNEVLELDELALEDGIRNVKYLDPNWKRANDVMNIACVWLIYAILNSTKLSPAQKESGCIDVALILQYKFMGSLMQHYFPYPADEATMLAAHAELSRKYALKKASSVYDMLYTRAVELLSPRSVHRRAYTTLEPDKDVGNMINDVQGRLREIVKSICTVFYHVRSRGVKIGTEKSVMEIDGQVILKDKSRNYSTYVRYLHDVIADKPSFVRQELVDVIADAMHTMPPKLLVEALEWMSVNHRTAGHKQVEELVDDTLIFAFEVISSNRDLLAGRAGLMPLLVKLRSLYMASRMSDPTLLKTKELSEQILGKAIKTKNSSVIASVRTGLQLYIVLRALSMSYYQN